jgi:hypothetical protein
MAIRAKPIELPPVRVTAVTIDAEPYGLTLGHKVVHPHGTLNALWLEDLAFEF